jgi:uncharacterized membrane-anchored protein
MRLAMTALIQGGKMTHATRTESKVPEVTLIFWIIKIAA